jgi:homoserine kinase type II
VQGKPAVLIPKIAGAHPLQPNLLQCREIGRALGKFHRVTTATELSHISCRSLDWVAATGARLLQQPSFADRELLSQEMAYLQRFVKAHTGLPQAIIHGDLFRDNTLFLDNRLTAIIDFFSAGQGFLMFDLAVVANDWCVEADGRLDPERLKTLLHSYSEARPPTAEEWTLWPDFLRIAALRFWVSRLAEKSVASTRSQPGTLQPEKDPNQYRKILTLRISSSFSWPL